MKLFPKLALLVSSLLIGTTIGLSTAFYWTQTHSIREQADQERHAILQNLVHIAQESLLANDDLLLVKYTGWLQKWNPSLISASVVGVQGQVIAHSEPDRIGKADQPIPEASRTEVLMLSEPVDLGTHWLATASVAFSQRYFEDQVAARLKEVQKQMLMISAAALAAGLLLSSLLAVSWTRPIARLVDATARIGQGKYDFDLALIEHRRDELGYLSRAFHTMSDELKELDTMKEDFVSAVTHELRSPLGAIESYLNVITEETEEGIIDRATWQSYLERLRLNTQRLTRFVNDLLDVAAAERGKVKLDLQPVAIDQIAGEVLSLFEPKLREKALTGALHASGPVPRVVADGEKIRQVLVNLISNAVKFTPAKGRIDVTLDIPAPGHSLRVAVRDSGLGIAPQDQAKIFNKFEQIHSARQTVKGPKGTGLGLSISRSLVELHGGRLTVESQPGEGSEFIFTLPLNAQGVSAERPVTSPGGVH